MDLQVVKNHKIPREQAVSSEPSSTRPNPFDDSDSTSRKRRRTSQSGSPARSIDTSQDISSSTTVDGDTPARDSVMKVDSEPAPPTATAAPKTPEPQTPIPRSSSKVTINLRNSTIASASDVASQTPTTSSAMSPTKMSGDTQKSVEGPEVTMTQAPAASSIVGAATPRSGSSSLGSGSSDVEALTVEGDDIDQVDPEHSFADGSDYIEDPCLAMPFVDAEVCATPAEAVLRVCSALETNVPFEEQWYAQLTTWLESCAAYFTNVGYNLAAATYAHHQSLWQNVPSLFWITSQRKLPMHKTDAVRTIGHFYSTFMKLAAAFAAMDVKILQSILSTGVQPDSHSFELRSAAYFQIVLHVVQSRNRGDEQFRALDSLRLTIFESFLTHPAICPEMLISLAEAQIAMLPIFPRSAEYLYPTCQILNFVVEDNITENQTQNDNIGPASNLVMEFYDKLSAELPTILEKYLIHMSNENSINLVRVITDLYAQALRGQHPTAVESVDKHQRMNPEISPKVAHEVISWRWRFDLLEKLIRSAQMQIRVQAVTQMCQDLVAAWKKYSEQPQHASSDEPYNNAFINYHAQHLLDSRLVDYILGPTCHPEIVGETGNIVGFLAVTKQYLPAHNDMLWQTMTSSQDPRIPDALLRMMSNILQLFEPPFLIDLCERMHRLPVDKFSPPIRALSEAVFKFVFAESKGGAQKTDLPFHICLRLLRESFRFSPEHQVAHQDVADFALGALKEWVPQLIRTAETRQDFALQCIQDIAQKSPTTLGSLAFFVTGLRPLITTEPQKLVEEHDLARLLIEELEHAIQSGKAAGYTLILSHNSAAPRRDLIISLLTHTPDMIAPDLGRKLWDMLVGPLSASVEDRRAGWQALNAVGHNKAAGCYSNLYLRTCFSEYLPSLPPHCFCDGALEFLKQGVLSRVNYNGDFQLDDETGMSTSGIEQLWRMILTSNDDAISGEAIKILTNGVYIDSQCIMSYPHHRARQVHLSLVNRCLRQLREAAQKLKVFGDGTANGDAGSMVITATEGQIAEQVKIFVRSLALLKAFLQMHQSKAHFASPDLRSYMNQSSGTVQGASAELKYQSFDGSTHTEIKPLNIGRHNTAASLLASIKKATGFDNFRIYYRGQPFSPTESQVGRSLEELKVYDGLILVKKEEQGAPPSARIKPGTSHLEIEILSHFKELWEYLSMDDMLAQEIYTFLIKLPAHDHVLEHFENESTLYKDVFAIGQTFKCLYAAYALKEYLYSVRRRVSTYESESDPGTPAPESYPSALSRVLALIIAAITDPDVIGRCQTIQLQLMLAHDLVGLMDWLLQEMRKNGAVANVAGMSYPPLDRFLNIIESARGTHHELHISLITKALSIVLDLCFMHPDFWQQFQDSPQVPSLIESLLLVDSHPTVREMTAKQLESRILTKHARTESSLDSAPQLDTDGSPAANTMTFTALVWSTLINLVPNTAAYQSHSGQLLRLTYVLAFKSGSSFSTPSLLSIALMCCDLLLKHTTTEQLGQASPCDEYANGLVKLLRWAFALDPYLSKREELPGDLAFRLFRKHLFPAERQRILDPVPRAIIHSATRDRLYEIVINLMEMNRNHLERIIIELGNLVPFEPEDEDPYAYDLSFTFDRSRQIRAPCGYVGLRNLSNTCYLNSLLTQLFMNTQFREFMTTAMVDEHNQSQRLVHHTQVLFAHMQETLRRFVDPTHLVHSIKTYDDTMIDIHNQMDVDEFYNLLFDRWESQLSTQEERKGLRSFYGGQLVQQVMSKECDHVSERLESFQAIQCDIKGKTTLQESLQAYVDGEIMEGDNKYKCSTCDRHVDAVKRACLKDIPDNLIFHLKRFDFNLRTLQRAKINDYFAFPNKIDMRPYTIDHITNPQDASDEDVFELVGVLVHAGTAESGHYYSYARERPSIHAEATWIEFNDDVVTPWDPANLEASTFGGNEYRAFEHPNVAYEKSYSAYMLFYQRSSSLDREQEDLRQAGLETPLQVQVPTRVSDQIRNENTTMLRRHCLYDPNHITFVERVLQSISSYKGQACSLDHDVETSVMRAALGHLDQVVTRAKDTPNFEEFVNILEKMIIHCPHCACAAEEYFAQYPDVLRMLVQKNPDAHVRGCCAKFWIDTLRTIKAHLPALYEGSPDDGDDGMRSWKEVRSVARTSVGVLELMWDNFHGSIRSWREVFGLVLQFARLGSLETTLLLADDWLYNTMRILWVDPTMTGLPQQFTRMLNNIMRRMTRTTPNYDTIIALIDHLQSNLSQSYDAFLEDARDRESLYNPNSDRQKLPWTTSEVNLVHYDLECRHPPGSLFVEKLVAQNQAVKFTDSIIARLVQTFSMLDTKIAGTLASNISYQTNIESDIQPYLRAAVQLCLSTTKPELTGRFLTIVTSQARMMANYDGKAMVDFFRKTINLSSTRYPESRLFEQAMECVPKWAPILLVGGNHLVRAHTEEFLTDVIFLYDDGDIDTGSDESSLLKVACVTARQLGLACVQYLNEKSVGESKQPSKDVIDGLDRILGRCASFYPDIVAADNESIVMDRSTYESYVNSIVQPLSQSAVDYVEDDGSDWDNSVVSSDPMDELNDLSMHGVGEPNDTELP